MITLLEGFWILWNHPIEMHRLASNPAGVTKHLRQLKWHVGCLLDRADPGWGLNLTRELDTLSPPASETQLIPRQPWSSIGFPAAVDLSLWTTTPEKII